jgi:hypothetical protein
VKFAPSITNAPPARTVAGMLPIEGVPDAGVGDGVGVRVRVRDGVGVGVLVAGDDGVGAGVAREVGVGTTCAVAGVSGS